MEKKTIGGLIAILRKEKGLTQKQLAEMLQVTDKTVSRWERDETLPDLTLIPVIAEIFGVTSDELLRGERKSSGSGGFMERDTQIKRGVTDGMTGARGEKQIQRILDAAKAKYRTHSIISIFAGVSGALVTIGFMDISMTLLGVALGTIIIVGAAAHQIICATNAFTSINDDGFDMESVKALKKYIVDKVVSVINILIVCLTVVFICLGAERPRVNSWGPIVVFGIGGFCLSYLATREIRERFKI